MRVFDPRGVGPATQYDEDKARMKGSYNYPPPPSRGPPPPVEPEKDPKKPEKVSGYAKALIAAAFVTGLGAGVYFDAEVVLSPQNVASTEIVDRQTPNAEVCMAYGYSAMVFDQRVFVTYNPFNVLVTQPEVKPGCVLRRSNVNILEKDKLVTPREVESCKKRMNTFGFVGDLKNDPQVSCLYHSEEAENQYLLNPKNALISGPSTKSRSEPASSGGVGGD